VPAPDIEPGGVETVPIPIEAGSDIGDGSVRLSVRVTEPYGHDAAPIDVELATRGLDPSELVLIEDFAVDGVELPVPRDSIVTLHLRVRNVGTGIAEDAVAEVSRGRMSSARTTLPSASSWDRSCPASSSRSPTAATPTSAPSDSTSRCA
jgi:hypothetical protein